MRLINRLLALLLFVCGVCLFPGCCYAPPHGHHHGHHHASVRHHVHVPQHQPPRCRIQYGEIMHPLVDPNGCRYLMGDSQFRQWQQPAPSLESPTTEPPATLPE